MSTSTDAILAYGLDLGAYPEAANVIEDENDEWWSWGEYAEELLKSAKLDLQIIIHCTYEYPMYFLASKSYTAHRGQPVHINDSLFVTPLDYERLVQGMKVLGLPIEEPFSWYLMSLWGI